MKNNMPNTPGILNNISKNNNIKCSYKKIQY